MFGTTGADAAELAIRLARWYTGAPMILSAYGGYHGTTGATMATTAKGGMWGLLPGAAGRQPATRRSRTPTRTGARSGAAGGLRPGVPGLHPADAARQGVAVHRAPRRVSNVAAVLLEPMQASAGYIIPGDGLLGGIRELCDEFGFLLIDDEIHGRHGPDRPDVGVRARAGGAGHDLGVQGPGQRAAGVRGHRRRRGRRVLGARRAHVGTFTASALASAAANATLDVYESEQLVERAADLGGYFADQLGGAAGAASDPGLDRRPRAVRRPGVRPDRATKEPAAEEAGWMLDFCVREGLLFEKGGYYYNRFQLIPRWSSRRT